MGLANRSLMHNTQRFTHTQQSHSTRDAHIHHTCIYRQTPMSLIHRVKIKIHTQPHSVVSHPENECTHQSLIQEHTSLIQRKRQTVKYPQIIQVSVPKQDTDTLTLSLLYIGGLGWIWLWVGGELAIGYLSPLATLSHWVNILLIAGQ